MGLSQWGHNLEDEEDSLDKEDSLKESWDGMILPELISVVVWNQE